MMGVYTIIGMSFAPNALEYYQVICICFVTKTYFKFFIFEQIFRGDQHRLIKGPLSRFFGGSKIKFMPSWSILSTWFN